jgi:hypothetical protein
MPDEIDRRLESIQASRRQAEEYERWLARYSASDLRPNVIWGHLSTVDCPYPELLESFARRATRAGLGEQCILLVSPAGQLVPITPHRTKHVTKRNGTRGGWLDKAAARRANQRLERDGRRAVLFRLDNEQHDGPDPVSASWIVAGNDYYALEQPTWGSREAFADICAQTLAKVT